MRGLTSALRVWRGTMTLQEVYQFGKQELTKAELESPAFDAVCLFFQVFGLNRHDLIVQGSREAGPEQTHRYRELIRRRAGREPLQYILGEWEFMGLSFSVGPEVLVPREDTRVLVEEGIRLIRRLGRPEPVVYDLCAGSGAVAAGIAGVCPGAQIWCFELSGGALPYLKENLRRHAPGAQICQMDILNVLPDSKTPAPDLILSNPPYIPTCDWEGLAPEVKREPRRALDGGEDGLTFYRRIAETWSRLLSPDGRVAVEIGAGQAETVCRLFEEQGMRVERVLSDLAGVLRVITVTGF